MPTSLNLLDLFSSDPAGYGPTSTLDMTQPAFANTLTAYKTTHQQALIGILSDVANSSINKDEFYNRMIFSYLTTILEAGLTPDPKNWTQQVDAIRALIQTGIANDGLKVKYFTSIPTTNVGASIFVEGQGQMHWDALASPLPGYKKDNFETHNDILRQTITYCWRYDLQKYHKTISMRATANAAGTINVVFPVAFEDYVSDPKLTDVANAAGATSVGAFAHSSTVTLTGFDAYCNFNSAAAGMFSIFVQGV